MRIALGAVLLLAAPGALAAEKLCIAPFKGPGADTVRSQVADNLCALRPCVPPAKVTRSGKPDFAKGKAEGVSFFVTGTVKAKGKKRTLELQVLARPGAPKLKKSYPLSGSSLGDQQLAAALAALSRAMDLQAAAEPEPQPDAKKEDPAAAEPEPKKEETAPPPEKKSEPAPPKDEARSQPTEPKDEGPRARPVKATFLNADLGVDLFSRSFSYSNPTANLRSYSAAFIVAPALRVELYPVALVASEGLLTGLGLEAGFAYAVGLKSRRSGSDVSWPTTLLRYDVGLRFRVRPVSSLDAWVAAFVGYSSRSFAVGTGSDGSTLDGLPNVSYSAIRPGLAGEVPFGSSGFSVFAKFAVQVVLSNGQIISPSGFFHKGSNLGIEAGLGAGYRLFGPLALRVQFELTRYGLGFSTEATDEYRANGAADLYLGGNVGLRLTF